MLVDAGYAGATTQAVCREAGCARGTLLYHFPTREALLVAALHKVLSDRVDTFMATASEPMSADTFVATLWRQWQDAPFTAWLELAVASRTNAALRVPLRDIMEDFDRQVSAAFEALVPGGTLPAGLEAQAPFFLFAVFNGLAVGQIYEAPGHNDPLLATLTQLAGALVAGPIGGEPWKS